MARYIIREHYKINLQSIGPKHKGRFYVEGFGDNPIMVHFIGSSFPDFFNRTAIKPLLDNAVKSGSVELCLEVEGEFKRNILKVTRIIRVCT